MNDLSIQGGHAEKSACDALSFVAQLCDVPAIAQAMQSLRRHILDTLLAPGHTLEGLRIGTQGAPSDYMLHDELLPLLLGAHHDSASIILSLSDDRRCATGNVYILDGTQRMLIGTIHATPFDPGRSPDTPRFFAPYRFGCDPYESFADRSYEPLPPLSPCHVTAASVLMTAQRIGDICTCREALHQHRAVLPDALLASGLEAFQRAIDHYCACIRALIQRLSHPPDIMRCV